MPDKIRTFKSSWDDALGPAFALGQGAAAPTVDTFMAPTRLWGFAEGTEDNVDFTLQFPHDMELDVATITLHPHVHWTAVSSPAANALLYWQLCYTLAKPSLTLAGATTFPAVTTLTSTVSTLTGGEYRKHLIIELPDINLAAASCAPSMVMVGNLRIGGDSTVGANVPCLLSFDVHYWKGPVGTDTEFV
jgi:hypothetical protein